MSRIHEFRVGLSKPVTSFLHLGLNAFKRAALVMRLKVFHVFKEKNFRFFVTELFYNSDYMEKQQSAFVFKTSFFASD